MYDLTNDKDCQKYKKNFFIKFNFAEWFISKPLLECSSIKIEM